uniref:Uncharacterized protein n=1 Tax=Rhizophora mucronata TaxID=61149 RepID=A0A2P2N4D9_RHIMU
MAIASFALAGLFLPAAWLRVFFLCCPIFIFAFPFLSCQFFASGLKHISKVNSVYNKG